jgi:hypothetical protein
MNFSPPVKSISGERALKKEKKRKEIANISSISRNLFISNFISFETIRFRRVIKKREGRIMEIENSTLPRYHRRREKRIREIGFEIE